MGVQWYDAATRVPVQERGWGMTFDEWWKRHRGNTPPDEVIRAAAARGLRVAVGPGVRLPDPPGGTADAVAVAVPPSTNNLFLTARGRRVKTPQYRAWLAAAVPRLRELRRPERFPVRVTVTLYGVNPGSDVANREKAIGDALVLAGVLPGDSIRAGLWETLQRYRPHAGEPHAVVTIEPVGVLA